MSKLGQRAAIAFLAAVVVLSVAGWLYLARDMPQSAAGTWSGVDVTVIEKYAAAAGRGATEPFINTNRGDLLLFVFAVGGAAGGFVAGYCWRRLISEKK